jgi:hypothetical protein
MGAVSSLPRLLLGFGTLFATRAVVKLVGGAACEAVLAAAGCPPPVDTPRAKRYAVELPTKLLTYGCVGFNAVAAVPFLFNALELKA